MNRLRTFSTRLSLQCFQLSSNILPSVWQGKINSLHSSSPVIHFGASRLLHSTGQNDLSEEEAYQRLVNRYLHVPEMGHQVLVVQPYVKWGPKKKKSTTPDLQLAEAVTLISTLSRWQTVDKMVIPVEGLDKKQLFGTGNLDKLKTIVKKDKNITAVFISINILKGAQRRDYEQHFKVPVFDRYTIVIQIFKEHAVTKNAKLQVALAEIPYLWAMLGGGKLERPPNTGDGGNTGQEAARQLLSATQLKLKSSLEKAQQQRKLANKKRSQLDFPVVAVVGYTNAGKTSVIKALTGEQQMQPRDCLFATLDVTAHEGSLPCRLRVLYIDTVGFMSDLPVNLIQCFNTTLEDVMLADLILHVCDLSHPDVKSQAANVIDTLRTLGVSEKSMQQMITIGNKVDKETLFSLEELNLHPIKISALNSKGVGILEKEVESAVLTATGRQVLVVRVPAGGDEARWLYKEAAVTEEWSDPSDSQYMMMRVVISSMQLARFKSYFVSKTVN